jgi:hypothetical protein
MQDHGHHLGVELHHLDQKAELAALFSEAFVQDIVTFEIRAQVVELGLVGGAQVVEEVGGGDGEDALVGWGGAEGRWQGVQRAICRSGSK